MLTSFKVICISVLFCSTNNVCLSFLLTNENVHLNFILTKITHSTAFDHQAYNFNQIFGRFNYFSLICQLPPSCRLKRSLFLSFWKFLRLLFMYYIMHIRAVTVRNSFAGNFTQKGLRGSGILFANVPFCPEILSWFFETAGPPLPDNGTLD